MASSLCPFCQHGNPAVAKFCNDCGSPLHLEQCRQCGAINDHAARNCYQCGAEIAVTPATIEPAPTSSIAQPGASSSLSRARRLEVLRESADEAVKAFAARQVRGKVEGVDPPDNMQRWKEAVERARQERNVAGVSFARATITGPPPEETRPRVTPMAPVGGVAGDEAHPNVQPSTPLGATQMVPLPVHGPTAHRSLRAALIALLVLVVPVSAYYVIRNSAQLELWLGMSAADQGGLTADHGRPPSSSPPAKIRVAPSSAPALGLGAAGVSNTEPPATEPSAESTSQITAAPNARDAPATKTGGISDDAGARTPAVQSDPTRPMNSSANAANAAPGTKQPAASRADAARPRSRPGRSRVRAGR